MAIILVVEDDVDLCDTYMDLLRGDGHTLYGVNTGTDAVDILVRKRIIPDVVILDMHLPGDSGTVILSLIRGFPRLARSKVIIASGHPDIGQWAVVQWKADLFLQKPISLEILKKAVNDFISGTNGSANIYTQQGFSSATTRTGVSHTNDAPDGP